MLLDCNHALDSFGVETSSRGWIKGITLTTWTTGADINAAISTHAHITALTTPSTHPAVLTDKIPKVHN